MVLKRRLNLRMKDYEGYYNEVIERVKLDKFIMQGSKSVDMNKMVVESVLSKRETKGSTRREISKLDVIKSLEIIEYLTKQYPFFKKVRGYARMRYICRVEIRKIKMYQYLKKVKELGDYEYDIAIQLLESKIMDNGNWLFGLKELGMFLDLKNLKFDYFAWHVTIVSRLEMNWDKEWEKWLNLSGEEINRGEIMNSLLSIMKIR
jgi:ribosomal protein L5